MHVMKEVVPHMKSQAEGKIVNVGSITVLALGTWVGAYAPSKEVVHSLSDVMRLVKCFFFLSLCQKGALLILGVSAILILEVLRWNC